MKRWYEFLFHVRWEVQNKIPATWVDVFLVDQVVPGLAGHLRPNDYWHIHRRWKPDKAGHEFRFACYTDGPTADKIGATIENHPAVAAVRSLLLDWPVPREEGGAELAMGNAHWSAKTKAAYPAFIQSVCEAFRGLLAASKAELPSAPPDYASPAGRAPSLDIVRAYYVALENKVQELWYSDGADAFLHMTHQVFGYGPFRARLTLASIDHVGFLLGQGYALYPDHVVVMDIRTLDLPPVRMSPAGDVAIDPAKGDAPPPRESASN
jgi:hypothetical protein